jgi:hypothetical protein
MTPKDLRDILRKVRLVEAAMLSGCAGITLQRWSQGSEPIPAHVAGRLAPLRDYQPMTARELCALIARAGGVNAVSRAIDIDHTTLERWMDARGKVHPTIAATNQLRQLWVQCEQAERVRVSSRPVPGVAPMSGEEFRQLVRFFGGSRRTADLLGCAPMTLRTYFRELSGVAPAIAVALREAAERRTESDRQITAAVRARVGALLAPRERRRDVTGQPVYRSRSETAACVAQLVAFVAASPTPVSQIEIRKQLGISRINLAWPLKVALRTGRLQREGQTWAVRYRATTSEVPTASGQPLWRASPGLVKRTSETVHAEALRIVALLAERGPLQAGEICAALDIPVTLVRSTLAHAARNRMVTESPYEGRIRYVARSEEVR